MVTNEAGMWDKLPASVQKATKRPGSIKTR